MLSEFVKAIPALSLSQESELRQQQVDRLRVEVADIDVLKEGYYLELKEDNKSVCKSRFCSADFAASKRAAENNRILDDTEPPLAYVCITPCKHAGA